MHRWVWVSSVLAPVFLIGGWTLAASRQPPSYDAARDTISALAAHSATDAWIMTVGLAALGVCHLITAAGFTAPGRGARAVLALGGAATVAVAASPQPAVAHVPAATVGFVALALWPALAVVGRSGTCRWVTVPLLVLLAWFAVALPTGMLAGVSERALAGAEALTPVGVVIATQRASRVKARPS